MPSIDLPDGEVLREREINVLRLRLQGMTSKEAAGALGLKKGTIESYTYHAYEKLGTHNLRQARRRLQELGLLESVMRETDAP